MRSNPRTSAALILVAAVALAPPVRADGAQQTIRSYILHGSSAVLVPQSDYCRLLHPPSSPPESPSPECDRVLSVEVKGSIVSSELRMDEDLDLDLGRSGPRIVEIIPGLAGAIVTGMEVPGQVLVKGKALVLQTEVHGRVHAIIHLLQGLTRRPPGVAFVLPLPPVPIQAVQIDLPAMASRTPQLHGAVLTDLAPMGNGARAKFAGLGGDVVAMELASPGEVAGNVGPASIEAPLEKRAPEIEARTAVRMTAGERTVHARASVDIEVRTVPLVSLDLAFAGDVTVIDLDGEDVGNWSVIQKAGTTEVHVELSRPVQDIAKLGVEYEVPPGRLVPPRVAGAYHEVLTVGVDAPGHLQLKLDPARAPWRLADQSRPPDELARLESDNLQAVVSADLFRSGGATVPLPPLSLTVVPLQRTTFVQAAIDVAEATTVATDDGHVLGRITYLIKNLTEQFLLVRMPANDVTLLSAFVAGRAVQTGRRADGTLLIPLGRSGQTASGAAAFPVELTYLMNIPRLVDGASIALALPHASVDVSTLRWKLELPAGWAPVDELGSVRRDTHLNPVQFAGVEAGEVTGPTPGSATALSDAGTTALAIAIPDEQEVFDYSADLIEAAGGPPSLVFRARTRTTGMVHRAAAFLAGLVLFYSLLRRSPRGRMRTITTLAGLMGTLVIVGVFSWASTTLGLAVHLALGLFMGAVIFGLASLAIGAPAPDETVLAP